MKHQYYIALSLMLASSVAWADGYRGYYRSSPYGAYVNPYRPSSPGAGPYPGGAPQLYDNQGHYRGPSNNNPYAPNPGYGQSAPYAGGSPYTPYTTPNPYVTNANPYNTNATANQYPPNSANNPYDNDSPYSPDNERNPYGSSPYNQNPAVNSYPPNAINNPYGANYPTNPSVNPYDPNSITSPYYDPNNINNPSVANPNPVIYPYPAGAQQLYDSQGNYQGTFSTIPYAPNAVSAPYVPGTPYPADSFNDPYGIYSPVNPYGQ